jgi:hypothetical protein
MAQYIDKSAIVTEIEKKRRNVEKRLYINNSYSEEGNTAWERDKALYEAYDSLLSFLDTTEAKNVDLEKEFKNFINRYDGCTMFEVAEHFFELGIKAQKGE